MSMSNPLAGLVKDPFGQAMAVQYQQQMAQYNQIALSQYLTGRPYTAAGQLQAPVPQEVAGETVLAIGPYLVRKETRGGVLYYEKALAGSELAWWKKVPSRAVLAATIRWDRNRRPRVNARDEFGSLLGVRYFCLTAEYHLQSPIQKTVWDAESMRAPQWDEGAAVRGTCGIHAAWPTRGGSVVPEIDAAGNAPANSLFACVRGQGKFVIGKEGWRAEVVIIDTVYLPTEIFNRWRVRKRLEKLYPTISFEEELWTLERSSKLARPIQPTFR